MFVRQRVAPKMFSTSRLESRSFTFCDAGGMPPHLRNCFQISTGVGCRLLLLQEQMELVHEIPVALPALVGLRSHAPLYLILHHQYPDLHPLLPRSLDAKADDGWDVHTSAVVEDVQGAG